MSSVDAVQDRDAVVIAGTTFSPVGAVGGVLSLLSNVVTFTGLLASDRLPAPSIAFTENV
ncbi:hypothetical protein D3C77_291720 [compost metagenome]